MAEDSQSTFTTFMHHCYYPIDIEINTKEARRCSSCFFMYDYGHPSSRNNTNIESSTTRHHPKRNKKRKMQAYNKSSHPKQQQHGDRTRVLQRLIQLQDHLDHLQTNWATINVVLRSLQNVSTIYPSKMATEDYLDSINIELSIAHDDLIAQIRSLDRNLRKLDVQIKSMLSA